MRAYELAHLSDCDLLRDLVALVKQDRATTARLLAHVAEVDDRRLYAPAGFPSMYEYCVRYLRLPEQAALKRIRVGRTARRFPGIFPALADGRLHMSGVILLAPYLTRSNADELLAAAEGKTKAEIELLLANRFPRPDVPARLEAIAPPLSLASDAGRLSPGTVEAAAGAADRIPEAVEAQATRPFGATTEQLSVRTVAAPLPKIKPLAPQRYALQLTIDQSTHDKLRHAQALLGHRIPSGDLAQVLDRALDALIGQLEKQKFAATDRPRTGQPRRAHAKRTIPARVKRAVVERDGGRCTFVSETGQRCSARTFLEFDHVDPVARGGEATVDGIRLRCRAHNHYEAERVFGAGFMHDKREAARREKERKQGAAADPDVLTALRALKFGAAEARQAAALAEALPDASLEERVKLALSYFRPRARSHTPAA